LGRKGCSGSHVEGAARTGTLSEKLCLSMGSFPMTSENGKAVAAPDSMRWRSDRTALSNWSKLVPGSVGYASRAAVGAIKQAVRQNHEP
jgi:hypothetical protein